MSQQAMLFFATALSLAGMGVALLGWRRLRLRQLAAAGVEDTRLASPWRALCRPMAIVMAPRGRDRVRTLARLTHAGRSGEGELERFAEEKLLGLVLGVGAGLGLLALLPGKPGLLLMLTCFALGLILPSRLVEIKIRERRDSVAVALPGAIDLLMTCVDAGLSMEQAIARVGREMSRASPVLAEEFAITANETEAGVNLSEALRRLSRRIDCDDLVGLCSIISQSYELGAPIVATLAGHAAAARKLRMAKLEEWAGKLAMKLIFPVALFLLPAAMVVMIGPAFAQVLAAITGH